MRLLNVIILLFVLFTVNTKAQLSEALNNLTLEAGGGLSRHLTTMDQPGLNLTGFGGTLRVMWHPEHLLSVGVETGYHHIYSIQTDVSVYGFGKSTAEVSMEAVPVMGVLSMRIFPKTLPYLEVKYATGIYLLISRGSGFGNKMASTQFSIGVVGAVTYLVPVTRTLSLGGELKYGYISKIQDSDLSLQIMGSWRFMTW